MRFNLQFNADFKTAHGGVDSTANQCVADELSDTLLATPPPCVDERFDCLTHSVESANQ